MQKELKRYQDKQEAIKDAEQRVKLAKAALDDIREHLLSRLLEKEKVQKGKLRARLDSSYKRASISWKSVVKDLKGSLFVEKLISEATRDEVFKVVVDYVE